MNTIFIVLPILTILMFDLGLTLSLSDFRMIIQRPKAVVAGLIGQILVLPLLAYILGQIINVETTYLIGIMLIACCPGGSSSNVFSMLAKGDVAFIIRKTICSPNLKRNDCDLRLQNQNETDKIYSKNKNETVFTSANTQSKTTHKRASKIKLRGSFRCLYFQVRH